MQLDGVWVATVLVWVPLDEHELHDEYVKLAQVVTGGT